MGMLGKLKFWGRKDELGMGDELAMPRANLNDLGIPRQTEGMPQMDMPRMQMPQMESFQTSQSYGSNKEMEIISAKLDNLRLTLENISQRIANLERIAYGEEDASKRRGW